MATAAPDHDQQSVDLIAAARSGTDSTLGRLLESHRPELTQLAEEFLGARLRRRMAVSDLVKDPMLSAGLQFPGFRGQTEAEFRCWLLEIFHSRLVDGIRRHQRAERRRLSLETAPVADDFPDPGASPSALLAVREDSARIVTAIAALPAELRHIMQLRYVDDLTFEQIAARIGVSMATVWRRWVDAVAGIRLIRLPTGDPIGVLTGTPPLPQCVSVRDDRSAIVCGGTDGSISVWHLPAEWQNSLVHDTDPELSLAPVQRVQVHNSSMVSVSWTDDGSVVSTGRDGSITVFRHHATHPVEGDASGADIRCLALAPTGVVTGSGDSGVRVAGGDSRPAFSAGAESRLLSVLAVSEDGRRIAAGDAGGVLAVFDRPTGRVLRYHPDQNDRWIESISFSPDGRFVTWTGDDSRIHRVRCGRPDSPILSADLPSTGLAVAENPDGRLLAVGGRFEDILLLDADALQPVRTMTGGTFCHACRFTQDSRRLVTGHADGTLRCWSVESGDARFAIRISAEPVAALLLADHDRLAVALTETGKLVLADLAARDVIGRLPEPAGEYVTDGLRPVLAGIDPQGTLVGGVPNRNGQLTIRRWPFAGVARVSAPDAP